jgi:succinate dehydrogenase/fumarate reductase flavoprotein subunit
VTPADVFHDRTLHYPFSSRDRGMWLDIAIQRAIRAGRGTRRGGVLVDFPAGALAPAAAPRPQHHPPASVLQAGDPVIELSHAAHAINGGIRISEWGEATVPGLFAVGETIGGPHGADRLGGGMLAACNVFGARAGRRAAEHAAASGRPPISETVLAGPLDRLASFQGRGMLAWAEVRRELKTLTAATLLVVRNGPDLRAMIERVRALRQDLPRDAALGEQGRSIYVLETENLLLTAELMARAALLREESRGSHFREDFPARDDGRWLVNIFWRSRGGEPEPVLARYRQEPTVPVQVVPVATEVAP